MPCPVLQRLVRSRRGGQRMLRKIDGGLGMASDAQKWPDQLWIMRHGQSESNVARRLAEAAAREEIGISVRDVDVALSALGQAQAQAVGRWLRELAPDARPNVVVVSP